MQKRDQLFDLIHSMSKAEKRIFKLRTQRQGEKNKYIELFDKLAAMDHYDEKALLAGIQNSYITRHLRQAKLYLRKSILRVLSDMYLHTNKLYETDMLLGAAAMLQHKMLYDQQFDTLIKAERKARENGAVLDAMRSLTKQMSALPFVYNEREKIEQEIDQRYEDLQNIMAEVQAMIDYRWVQARMSVLLDTVGTPRDEADLEEYHALMRLPRMQNPDFLDNPLCKVLHCDISYNYSLITKNWAAAERAAKGQVEIATTHPAFEHVLPRFLVRLSQVYMSLLDYVKFNELKNRAFELNTGAMQLPRDIRHLFNVFNIQLLSHCGRFEDAYAACRSAAQEMRDAPPSITRGMEITTYYHFFYACFGAGNFKEALDWLRRITEYPAQEMRTDIGCFAHIAKLITHFELGDMSAMDYILRSCYRHLSRKKRIFFIETLVMDFISELNYSATPGNLNHLFRRYREKLQAIRDNRTENAILGLFHLDCWLASKIEQRPFPALVREMAGKRRAFHLENYDRETSVHPMPDKPNIDAPLNAEPALNGRTGSM